MTGTPAQASLIFLLVALPLAAGSGDELGRKVFTATAQPPCGLCHTLKAAGAAGTLGPSLDELKPDEARTLQAVRKGVGVMPPYTGKLSDEEIAAVARYVARTAGGSLGAATKATK